MAKTENLHTGDASKTKFSFTFPYLNQTDVEVYKYVTNAWVKQTITTHYTFDNATTIKFGAAPAAATTAEQTNLGNNKNVKIKRNTSGDSLAATFYPGSAIRAGDLNDNYTQNLYVTQEASNLVTDANTDAAAALTKATAAETDADASILATDAFVAKNTAAAGETPVWVVRGNAGTDSTEASDPQSGVGKAITDSAEALAKALEAIDDADAAVTTANSAEAAVSTVLPYTIKANAAAVQALFGGSDSPTADDIFELTATDDLPVKIFSAAWASGTTYKVNDQRTNDSGKLYLCTVAGTSAGSGGPTGTGSSITDNTVTWKYIAAANGIWTISSVPDPLPTFSTGITVKLKYASGDASASTWSWQSYHANNPETRYAPTESPTFTGTPYAPTADTSTSTTQIATTAFAQPRDADLTSLSSCQSGSAAALALLTSTEVAILDGATLSTAELNYVDGVTSAIQTQLDAKGVGDAVLASDQSWSGAQRGTIPTPATHSSGATYDFDLDAGNNFKLTISATVELGFSNRDGAEGQSGTIEIVNGAITPSWGTECHFVGGTVIDLTQSVTSYLSYYVPSASAVVVKELLDVKAQS